MFIRVFDSLIRVDNIFSVDLVTKYKMSGLDDAVAYMAIVITFFNSDTEERTFTFNVGEDSRAIKVFSNIVDALNAKNCM